MPVKSSTSRGLVLSSQTSLQVQGLSLNIFEVELNKTLLNISGTPYSKLTFDQYKDNEAYKDFYFYRFHNTLYAWKRRETDKALPNGFEIQTISIDEHAPIFRKIVEEAIVEYFKQRDFRVYKVKYSSNWEVTLKKEQPEKFGGLSLIPTLIFSVTNLYSVLSGKQIIALAISKRYVPRFTASEAELNRKHIDTRDWNRNTKGEISASSKNRRLYLEVTNQSSRYLGFLHTVWSDRREFEYLKSTWKSFNEIRDRLYLPDEIQVSTFLFVSLPSSTFEALIINKPQYYFHNEKTKAGDYYDRILSELRPYSYDLFANRKVRIVVITPEEYEGSVDEYLVKLRQVLERTMHLRNVEFELVTIPARQAYSTILEEIDPANYDLAIVVVSQQHKKLAIQQSPYYVLKAKLLNQRLPTQDLTIEVLRQSNKFINNNIALNVYSKLGGTAWTIEKIEKNVSELIVGIGSTTDEQANLVIGFANIFDYNGTYLLGDCSQLSSKDNYAKNLATYLVKGLKLAFERKNISEGDPIRLVFHIFKEAGEDYEIEAIEKALAHFHAYSIKYALVHLSYNHNYRVFLREGNERPRRGTFIQIATYQALLHLGGKSVVPVLVRMDKRSSYKDIYSITKQVLFFSHLSHRTFTPPSKPVTIKYPSLMAKLVSELKQVSGWDIDVLNKISDKLWFI